MKIDNKLCSFCNRSENESIRLLGGNGIYICNKCVDACKTIFSKDSSLKEELRDLDKENQTHELRAELESNPNDPCAHFELANALWGAQHHDEAIKCYKQAIALIEIDKKNFGDWKTGAAERLRMRLYGRINRREFSNFAKCLRAHALHRWVYWSNVLLATR